MSKKFILKFFAYFLIIAMFLAGLLIFTYPLLSGYVSDRNTAIYIEDFEIKKNSYIKDNKESQNAKALNKLHKEMQTYNTSIYENGQEGLCDAWAYEQSSINLSEYGINDGAVGVLKVPKMGNLEMPIFLGASRSNMSHGAAQLGETSLPIGGNNTNCVLAGHRGWNGARYFLDIEQMEIGDMVYIENFWDTLSYKVTDIKIIDPNEIDEVLIQKNKDMVTLITCHPYWASTYRYAVFCTRVSDDNPSDSQLSTTEPEKKTLEIDQTSKTRILLERLSYAVIPLLLIALIVFLIIKREK